jgi:NAD(P)-dependent dehydrogenase (short-subunit alcohol dehydrogenase family)
MTITFITGANKGLGYETARRLSELGQTVILGARDPQRGRTAAEQLGLRFVPIDVTSDDSVARAAADILAHEGRIDVLINNAGILGSTLPAEQLTGKEALEIMNTNVAGIVRVTHAFLPLLRRSEHPSVINISSGMGSFTLTHDPERVESKPVAPLYTASKAAVTMLTTQYARALPDIRINAVDPGYTATDFNGHSGYQTVTEGTDAVVTLATEQAAARPADAGTGDTGTGRVISRSGPVPW